MSNVSFKDLLYGFCVWCASSIFVCVILYLVFELGINWFGRTYGGNNHGEDHMFDDVVNVVREMAAAPGGKQKRQSQSNGNKYKLEFEVESNEEVDKSIENVETGNLPANPTPVIKRIIVKPWQPD